MKINAIIPAPSDVIKQTVIILVGTLLAAYVISRFPKVKAFVKGASITVDDSQGTNYL